MSDFKCLAECVKNCAKTNEVCPDHTNKDCHVKKFCRCNESRKFKNDKKEGKNKNDPKICKICCCLREICKCENKSPPKKCEKCICCITGRSIEREICKVCCCLLKNCVCKDKASVKSFKNYRPRKLCEDLPLYDEKSHLIGYIKKGAIIDEPYCDKSQDKVLEANSSSDTVGMDCVEVERACMASCRYAEGVRRDCGEAQNVPRWTTKSAFEYATNHRSRTPIRTQQTSVQQKYWKKSCPCGK